MKLVWVVVGLALVLTGVGVACGPEQKYCYQQHVTCTQAQLDKQNKDEQDRQQREDAGLGPDPGDSAPVVGE
jgi:uncharacterized protein HemX